MSHVIEAYLRQVERALGGDPTTRKQIIAELRSHLHERVRDLQAEDPDSPVGDIERAVLSEFGSADELAVAYGPAGPELRRDTGELVLRVGAAAARGTGKVLKGVAVALGVCLVLTIGVGVWAFYEVRPYVEDVIANNLEETAYAFHESCTATPCEIERLDQRVHIDDAVREMRLSIEAWDPRDAPGAGAMQVVLRDPDGAVRYQRNYTLDDRGHTGETVRLPPTVGDWRIDVSASGLVGSLHVRVETVGRDTIR